jgi:CheY-like chemotaxis protein
MFVEALLLTNDQQAARMLKRVLDSFAIPVRNAESVAGARAFLQKQKIDAALIDCDVPDAPALITELRSGKANRMSVVFAITGPQISQKQAFDLGASFVLPKPISVDLAMRSVRASHGLILRERRRYFRHEVNATASLSFGDVRDLTADLVNLSEGGALFALARRPDMKGNVNIRMNLPGLREPFSAGAEFVWNSDKSARTAVRFTNFSGNSKTNLEQWLTKKFEESESPASRLAIVARR